jgi:HSP20 family molecular chaperone IbpA
MIRELGETIGNTVVESVGRAVGRTQEQRPLPADLLESDDAYLVVFDAPGVDGADVQVRFEDETVFVRLDRFRDFHEGFEMRFPGRGLSLDGDVTLPADALVDPTEATATLKDNGTLQVRIPKLEVEETDADTVEMESAEEHDEETASTDTTTVEDESETSGPVDVAKDADAESTAPMAEDDENDKLTEVDDHPDSDEDRA